ncbi:hypothetical protein ACP3VS_18195 [Lysinibacillus sp. VIII_CA]|uniref:hypothetical protein n=1 Tax=Lysinibacillus sp. VIII_CA TaxID=3417452 RepID=UPI003CEE8EB0
MKKPFYKKWWFILIVALIVIGSIGNAIDGDDEKASDKADKTKQEEVTKKEVSTEPEKESEKKNDDVVVDMKVANDTTIPLEERIVKIATDLFGTTTTDGSDRNITVENMGDIYYLKMMIDDAITKKNTLNYAQQNTVELLKVLKDVEDMRDININWQANFKDASGNSNVGSAMTVLLKKSDIDKIDFDKFKASNLKEVATNYGTHNDFK